MRVRAALLARISLLIILHHVTAWQKGWSGCDRLRDGAYAPMVSSHSAVRGGIYGIFEHASLTIMHFNDPYFDKWVCLN